MKVENGYRWNGVRFFLVFLVAGLVLGAGGNAVAAGLIQVGSTVAAPWSDGELYLGTVKAMKGDTADVLYADDGQVRPVKISELKLVEPKTWSVGDHVLAVWSSGKFYPGVVSADKGGGVYTVKWDDGDTPSDVAADRILGLGGPSAGGEITAVPIGGGGGIGAGSLVAAPWSDGAMYLGTVQSVSGGVAQVRYEDDQQVRPVPVAQLRPIPRRQWFVGNHVLAVWSDFKFYPGVISADKGGGLYTVKWDDGDTPLDVDAGKIMKP